MATVNIESSAAPARYFLLLSEFLQTIGVRGDDILDAAHIDPDKYYRGNLSITPFQMQVLIDVAHRHSGRSDLAFELGRRITLHSHDTLSFALLSCSTPDHLLRLFARFYRLITPMVAMDYRRNGEHVELVFSIAHPLKPQARHFMLETATVAMIGQLLSVLRPRPGTWSAFMPFDAPAHQSRYAELGEVEFQFLPAAASEVRMQFSSAALDAVLPTSNPAAAQLAEDRCQAMLRENQAHGSWSEWVRAMLEQAEDALPTQEHLAAILNVTPRTLCRYLKQEDASFRAMLAQARARRARALLANGTMAISDIAYALGYTDLASFSRSFKRLHGVCPTDYRWRCLDRSQLRAA